MSPDVREDIEQVVWMKVYRSLHTFRGDSLPTTWIHTIARNEVYQTLRYRSRRPEPLPLMNLVNDDDHRLIAPETITAEVEFARKLKSVQRGLKMMRSSLMRRVIVAFSLEGKSIAEISEEMGISEGAVRILNCRGRKKLKQIVRNLGDLS